MQKKVFVQSRKETCTEDFADYADKSFPQMIIHPGVTKEEIMYNAGQREMVDWIKRHIQSSVLDNQINRQVS